MLWQTLSAVIPSKNKTLKSTYFDIDVNKANEHFTEEPTRIVQNYLSKNEENRESLNKKFTDSVYSIPIITENTASKIINNLSGRKATGIDGIPLRFLKLFKFSLMPIFLLIMNISIRDGIFPTLWKTAKLYPLFKSGSKKDLNNYRPIALLPILSKVIEKYVKITFTEYLNSKNLLSKLQFGFKKSHSTADAILSVIKSVSYALNNKQKCVMISIDLKKCFDLVDHEILIHKLRLYGCDTLSIKWFKSYLIDRYNFVMHNKHISDVRKTKLSVPQGGCLSTILFLVFINDIFKVIIFGILYLFADDLTLVVVAKTYDELEVKANSDLKAVREWLITNKLVPNIEKSNFIIMGCPLRSTKISLKLGNNELKRVYQTKVLGVTVDHDLRFDDHIQNISKPISNKIKFISRLRHFIPEKTLNLIFKSLVFPIFDYCDIVWGFTYNIHIIYVYKYFLYGPQWKATILLIELT